MNLRRSNDLECARQARRSVQFVRQRLVNPTAEALESCAPHLRVAIDSLGRLQQRLASLAINPDAKILGVELKELRRELGEVNALMEQAAGFHAMMADLLWPEDKSISYAATGVVPVCPAATLLLEG